MLDMFDYIALRPAIEPVFHDHMDIANTIIKAIQTYHDDEDYVPKVRQSYSMANLENTVIFQIDSQKLAINDYDCGYDVSLVATRFDITEERPLIDYKMLISAYCHIPHRDDIHSKKYFFATHGDPYDSNITKEIESGIFEKYIPEVLGELVWAVMQERFKMVHKEKQRWKSIADLDPDSLMMEPELLWHPMKENKNGENKET